MKIAIIAAMDKELALLLPLIQDQRVLNVNGTEFHSGRIGSHEIVALRSGIGKVNAAVATLTLIDHFHPSLVINTGVAGGTGPAKILDVVIPTAIAYHDVWCGPDTIWGQAAGCPPRFDCPLSEETIEKLGAKTGLLASGDIFISRPQEVAHILELYPDAVACDMESAAIAQVCHMKNVPFICIRVISDTPGADDNISQYENFWQAAPESTFKTLENLLQIL